MLVSSSTCPATAAVVAQPGDDGDRSRHVALSDGENLSCEQAL